MLTVTKSQLSRPIHSIYWKKAALKTSQKGKQWEMMEKWQGLDLIQIWLGNGGKQHGENDMGNNDTLLLCSCELLNEFNLL